MHPSSLQCGPGCRGLVTRQRVQCTQGCTHIHVECSMPGRRHYSDSDLSAMSSMNAHWPNGQFLPLTRLGRWRRYVVFPLVFRCQEHIQGVLCFDLSQFKLSVLFAVLPVHRIGTANSAAGMARCVCEYVVMYTAQCVVRYHGLCCALQPAKVLCVL